jgi:glycosyltransferase involved in cell wall biosynthesis
LVPVEAQAAGTPVIAYARGGGSESILEGVTGVLFQEQTTAAIGAAMEQAEAMEFDPVVLRENAKRFSAAVFRSTIGKWLASEWSRFRIERGCGAI